MASLVEVVKFELRQTTYGLFSSSFSKARFTNFRYLSMFTSSRPEENKDKPEEEGEFRTLNLRGGGQETVRARKSRNAGQPRPPVLPPRYTRMPVDQDWPSVWPTAQSFKASVVPLPIRMGSNEKGAPPDKFGNTELMKIPNFLHLTPPAIKRHCAAIKKFCTPWPKELVDDETCEKHFPLSVTTNDYVHAGPSIRDPKARIVTIKLKVSDLELNGHAKDKLLRLVGDRYDNTTGEITIVTDRCPLKKQNYDYAMYLLTALYYESWKTETWEFEKDEEDAECYDWDKSKSRAVSLELLKQMKIRYSQGNEDKAPAFLHKLSNECKEDDLMRLEEVKSYSQAVTSLHNEGEDTETIKVYQQSVLKLLNLNSASTVR